MKVLFALLTVFLLSVFVCGQDDWPEGVPTPEPTPYVWPTPVPTPTPRDPDHDHDSNSLRKRFADVGMLPPFQITEAKLPDSLRVQFLDEEGWHVENLTIDENSVIPANLWKEYRDRWYWVIYCERDRHIYTLTEVARGQMRATRAAPQTARKFP